MSHGMVIKFMYVYRLMSQYFWQSRIFIAIILYEAFTFAEILVKSVSGHLFSTGGSRLEHMNKCIDTFIHPRLRYWIEKTYCTEKCELFIPVRGIFRPPVQKELPTVLNLSRCFMCITPLL